jgi:2OG-Fe(II) oxygenase superfamily
MNKEEIAPGIVVYSDVIPNSENLYLDIEEGMASANISWIGARVKTGSENDQLNTKTRDTQTIGVPYYGGIKEIDSTDIPATFFTMLNNIFFQHFDPIEKDYMSDYGIFSTWHDTYGILKYGVGQQFTNHIDDHPDYHRRMSFVYYLNDNYKGGEINFPRFNITFKPKANQMIVFPSTYVYNHSVSPVIEGERYAVVGWLR